MNRRLESLRKSAVAVKAKEDRDGVEFNGDRPKTGEWFVGKTIAGLTIIGCEERPNEYRRIATVDEDGVAKNAPILAAAQNAMEVCRMVFLQSLEPGKAKPTHDHIVDAARTALRKAGL